MAWIDVKEVVRIAALDVAVGGKRARSLPSRSIARVSVVR